MKFLAKIFRGRQHELDAPVHTVTIQVQGSAVTEKDLRQVLQRAIDRSMFPGDRWTLGRYRDQIGEPRPDDTPAMPAAAIRDAELMRVLGWGWAELNATPEHIRGLLWRLIQGRPDDGPSAGVPA